MIRPLKSTQGFTIIEVMLFLSISGLMMVGVIVMVSGSINRQRYNDAVYSTLDYLKHQYNSVANTHNNRSADTTCIDGAIKTEIATGRSRGTTDCYIVGRVIRSNDTTSELSTYQLSSYPVLATRDLTSTAVSMAPDELTMIKAMGLLTDDVTDSAEFVLPYQTHFVDQSAAAKSLPFSMLIIRMPISNLLRTYLVTGPSAQSLPIEEIIAGSESTVLCLESNGLIGSSNNGVRFTQGVSGASALEFAPGELCG